MQDSAVTQAVDAVCGYRVAGLLVRSLTSGRGLVQNCEGNFRGQVKVLV